MIRAMRSSRLNSIFLIILFAMLPMAVGCDWFTAPSGLLPLDRPIWFDLWQDVKYQPRAISLVMTPWDQNRFKIEAETRIKGNSIEIRIKGLKELPFQGNDTPTLEYCDLGSLQPGDYRLSFIADHTTDLPLDGGSWQVSVTLDSITFIQETMGWCRTVDNPCYQIVPIDLMWGRIHWSMVNDSTLFAAFVDSFTVIGGSSENVPQGNFGMIEIGSEVVDKVISPPYFYTEVITLRFQGDPISAIELREAFLDNHMVPSSVDPTVFKRPFSVTLHFGIGYKG